MSDHGIQLTLSPLVIKWNELGGPDVMKVIYVQTHAPPPLFTHSITLAYSSPLFPVQLVTEKSGSKGPISPARPCLESAPAPHRVCKANTCDSIPSYPAGLSSRLAILASIKGLRLRGQHQRVGS